MITFRRTLTVFIRDSGRAFSKNDDIWCIKKKNNNIPQVSYCIWIIIQQTLRLLKISSYLFLSQFFFLQSTREGVSEWGKRSPCIRIMSTRFALPEELAYPLGSNCCACWPSMLLLLSLVVHSSNSHTNPAHRLILLWQTTPPMYVLILQSHHYITISFASAYTNKLLWVRVLILTVPTLISTSFRNIITSLTHFTILVCWGSKGSWFMKYPSDYMYESHSSRNWLSGTAENNMLILSFYDILYSTAEGFP